MQGQTYASDHIVYNAAGQPSRRTQYSVGGALLMKKAVMASATTVDHYSAGVLTQETLSNSDGSHQTSNYGVTGQSYASDHSVYNAAGTLVGYDQYSATNNLLLKTVMNAAGTTTDHHSAAGALLNESVLHVDGSRDYANYAVTGQSYTKEHIAYNAVGVALEGDQYAATGTLQTKVVTNPRVPRPTIILQRAS